MSECEQCAGDGWYPDHSDNCRACWADPDCSDTCPVQRQCEACGGQGVNPVCVEVTDGSVTSGDAAAREAVASTETGDCAGRVGPLEGVEPTSAVGGVDPVSGVPAKSEASVTAGRPCVADAPR